MCPWAVIGPPSPLRLHSAYYMRREATLRSVNEIHSVRRWCCSAPQVFSIRPSGLCSCLDQSAFYLSARRRGTTLILYEILQENLNMPRSFLVKKYFSNKKTCYRESHLESQSGKFDLVLGCLLRSRDCHVAEKLNILYSASQCAAPGKLTNGKDVELFFL